MDSRAPWLVALALSGCTLIDQIGPQNRLSDQVHAFNEEVRWGRIDLAAQRVAPAHRAAFVAQHRAWGHDVRVADADITHLAIDLPDGHSSSLVTFSWVNERTMELYSTTVRQLWSGDGESFALVDEEIVGGEPSLLPGASTAPEPGSAGGEAGGAASAEPAGPGEPAATPTEGATPAPSPVRRDAQGVRIR